MKAFVVDIASSSHKHCRRTFLLLLMDEISHSMSLEGSPMALTCALDSGSFIHES